MTDQITYKAFCEQHNKTIDAVRMKVRRKLGKQSVNENDAIPPNVLSMLTGGSVVSSVAPVQKEVSIRQPKPAKQATIPMQINNTVFAADQTPQKSIFTRVNSFLNDLDEVAGMLFVECVMLSYGLISKYGAMGVGLSMLYALYSRYVVRLSKKEKTVNTANSALNFFIGVQILLVYVHCNMYYNEMTADKGLMFDPANIFAAKFVSIVGGAITSLFVIVSLTHRIRETRERAEYDYQNAPAQN